MSGFLDRAGRVARTWALNTVNTSAYVLSGGETTLHEGRYDARSGRWSNWSRTFACRPARYVTPASEEAVCAAVREAARLRVVGGGHTFNACPLTEDTLLSLDRYRRVLEIDRGRRTARVQSGVRLRDLTRYLEARGLTLPLMGSTNAQSIGGLLATDLHGTGRDHGFLSEQVLSLRVVNARGEVETLRPGDAAFHAVMGGLGCCGVVTEVELQCVDAYNLERSLRVVPRRWAEENIEQLLGTHRHLSFYYLGGADVEHVRMNVWDETRRTSRRSVWWNDMQGELIDMLFSGYLLGMTRSVKKTALTAQLGLAFFKATMDGRKTVYSASVGFRRRLYYQHDELEYGVPLASYRACLEEVEALLRREKYPCLIEVRFTPDRSQALLGPGVGRRTCFLELAPGLSRDPAEIFPEAEKIFWRHQGQAHLGKATWATPDELRAMFGERFDRFREVRRRQDGEGKFDNAFTRQLFGP